MIGHGGRALMKGIHGLIKETPESSLSLRHVGTQQENGCLNQEEGPQRNLPTLAPWSQTHSPQNCEKETLFISAHSRVTVAA